MEQTPLVIGVISDNKINNLPFLQTEGKQNRFIALGFGNACYLLVFHFVSSPGVKQKHH